MLQGHSKFEWKDQAVTGSGVPARLSAYSFDLNGNSFDYVDLQMAYSNDSLKITTSTYQKNAGVFNEWTKRVMNSVKFEPKKS